MTEEVVHELSVVALSPGAACAAGGRVGATHVLETRDPMNDFLAQVEHQAYRMAQYALWDHELALDVVQDSMLKLVQRYRGKPAGEWPALFFTILNNRINDARRQRLLHKGINKIISLFDRQRPEGPEQVEHVVAACLVGLPRPLDEKQRRARLARKADRAVETCGEDAIFAALDRKTQPELPLMAAE